MENDIAIKELRMEFKSMSKKLDKIEDTLEEIKDVLVVQSTDRKLDRKDFDIHEKTNFNSHTEMVDRINKLETKVETNSTTITKQLAVKHGIQGTAAGSIIGAVIFLKDFVL